MQAPLAAGRIAGGDFRIGELTPLGPDLGGVPLGTLGFALSALGSFLLIAGVMLHVSAAAKLRRRQAPR